MIDLQCIAGTMTLEMPEKSPWKCKPARRAVCRGVEELELTFTSPTPATPPETKLTLLRPMLSGAYLWRPDHSYSRALPPNWAEEFACDMTLNSPCFTVFDSAGKNIISYAVSDAMRRVLCKCGVIEENCMLQTIFRFFTVPEAPQKKLRIVLRFDVRKKFYADSIADMTGFFEHEAGFLPTRVPAAARKPIYSTWYSYHQNLFAPELEEECRLAAELGMKGIIVDDGWQTMDNQRGYAFCGDWEIAPKRFPDMPAHVAKIHALGMKYMVWFSVPFVGEKSHVRDRFKKMFLYDVPSFQASVLDPRFPEVREYLIGVYERCVREWDIDGLKLDFIGMFSRCKDDPAPRENYAGRDCKLIPEAVDLLLSGALKKLKTIKPDILIEFRQDYIGPAIRTYGNMFRAVDCPADLLSNRARTIDLRLTSGNTAVHADMLMFHKDAPVSECALQLLNVLFSVPQISVRLGECSPAQRAMLKHYLKFMVDHEKVLQHGKLIPLHPEMLYPLVYAKNSRETIAALYCSDCTPELGETPYCALVNASGCSLCSCDFLSLGRAIVRNAVGRKVAEFSVTPGLAKIEIPASGMLELFRS